LRLRRGHILLVAGGAIAAISISVLGYYGMRLVANLDAEERYRVEPNGSVKVEQNISSTNQATYAVTFPNFTGGMPTVTIRDPADKVILEKRIQPPIVIEPFPVSDSGVYTLTLYNPSPDQVLEASILVSSQESLLGRADDSSGAMTVAFALLLVAGISAAIAGAVITILDKRRTGKMKQFGDTSDLV